MRSIRRVTTRVVPALASVASVLLFATCDFDKISGTPTPLTQQEIDRLFSITPTDTTVILGGTTTLNITPGAGVDLSGIAKEWTSNAPTVVSINSATGVATGIGIGNAIITARLLAPELDTGYSKTRALRVRYKNIKACGATSAQCSPSPLDSITGLNLSRPVNFFGTNNSDAVQATSLNATTTITTHDSGSTNATVTAMTSNNVFARKNGVAYVVGVFESMRDSIKVKVRQVAKSLTFPTTDYTANAINANRTLPIQLRDVNDSVMTSSPVIRWRSSDATVVTIDSLTGVLRVLKKDTARIFVRVDTVNRSQKLVVKQAISSLTKFAGDVLSDTVARLVTVAPTVTVVDSGNTAIQGDTVIFRVGTGGGAITDSVKLSDANGRAAVGSWKLGTVASAQTLIATSGGKTATFTVTGIPQRPFKLGFQQQPRSSPSGTAISPAVTVIVRDSLNNPVNTATDSVFIAIGNNPGAATLSGTQRVAAVNGVATFSNLTLSAGGSGYTLLASAAGGLEGAVSDAFDVFGAATKLAVIRQPVGTSVGAILDSIKIAVQDTAGNVVANDTRNITLAIGNNPASGTLSGTTTVTAVGGIATFTGLSINAAGSGYTLTSSAAGLTAAATNPFNIAAVGPAAKLAFTTQPGNVQSGATPNLAVTVQDANGATVSSSTASITITLIAGTASGTLIGTTTRSAVSGVATFPGISIDKVGNGYKFAATSASLTGAESNAFNVTPGAASKLGFIDQPTHTVSGTAMQPSVTVAVQDANGNTVTGGTAAAVSLTVTTCTSTPNSGLGPINTVNGIATFPAVTLGSTVNGCVLTANATGLSSATSTSFNSVSATGAIRLVFGTQPSQTTAGSNVASFTVRAVDQSGATVATAAPFVTLSILSGPSGATIFQGSSTTASSGVATFSVFQLRTSGTYKLLATASGFKSDSSAAFNIVPGTVNRVAFVTQPANITAGSAFDPPVSAAFQDQYFNTVPTATGSIDIGFNSNPTATSLVGTTNVPAVNGIATFNGLTINKVGTAYSLVVFQSGSSLFGQTSNTFNVNPGPVSKITLSGEPGNTTAGSAFSVTASATDAGGNTITTFNSPITIGITGGDPIAILKGTTTLTPTNGVALFSGLSVEKAANAYKLTASASGLTTTISSNSFNVSASSATKLGWLDQPSGAIQKGPLHATTTPRVAAQDQYGNTVTSFCCTIQIAIGTSPGGISLLSGGSTVSSINLSTSSGIATLTNVSLSGSGNGVTLSASTPFNTPALTAGTSQSFNLAAFGPKSKLTFVQQPSNGTYAVALSPAVTVAIQDAYGNTVTNATDLITLAKSADPSSGTATLSGGSATAAVAGVATFANVYLDKAFNVYSLQATATGLTAAISSTFNILTPGHIGGVSNMADMTLMNGRIYWLEAGATGSLNSVAVTGGSVTTYAITIANAARIANDGTNLYWIEAGSGGGTGSVRRFNPAVGGTPTTLANSLSNVRNEANTFAIDGTNVYFVGTNALGTLAAIRSVPMNAASPQVPTDLFSAAGTTSIHYFTVSGGNIFFQDASTGIVKRMSTSGGTPTSLTFGGVNAQRLVLGGTTLYFTEGTNIRTVVNATTASSAVTPSTPVSGLSFISAAILEGNNLYIKTGNTVRRYDVTTFGGTATLADLATNGQADYESLVLDGTHIYYSNFSSGIGKVLK